eukprot:14364825-Ditylum_brightwellii.AAC.1
MQKSYVHIPRASNKDSAHSLLQQTGFVDTIVKIFGAGAKTTDNINMGAEWSCIYLANNYEKEFKQVATKKSITYHQRQTAIKTAAMMDNAKITKTTLQVIAKHLNASSGKPVLATEKKVNQLSAINTVQRCFGRHKLKSSTGKKMLTKDKKEKIETSLSNHGNEAFRVAMGVTASEKDGQPRP